MTMTVKFKIFRAGSVTSWETVATNAARFASAIPHNLLISISHSSSHETQDTIIVWYWA